MLDSTFLSASQSRSNPAVGGGDLTDTKSVCVSAFCKSPPSRCVPRRLRLVRAPALPDTLVRDDRAFSSCDSWRGQMTWGRKGRTGTCVWHKHTGHAQRHLLARAPEGPPHCQSRCLRLVWQTKVVLAANEPAVVSAPVVLEPTAAFTYILEMWSRFQ